MFSIKQTQTALERVLGAAEAHAQSLRCYAEKSPIAGALLESEAIRIENAVKEIRRREA